MPVRENWNELKEPRQGITLHYDASSSDAGAVAWFSHPECKVSYNFLVLDDGRVVPIAPRAKRAWHMGSCRPHDPSWLNYKDANSAFYGVAIAANHKDTATEAQVAAVVRIIKGLFIEHGWPLTDAYRITSHHLEAWPRGRKIDVARPGGGWVLDLDEVRRRVAG